MRLDIVRVADEGKLDNERLLLEANGKTDVGNYLLLPTGVQGDRLTTPARNPYWFPDKQVEVGDLVVVYTKVGADTDRLLDDGQTVHFFYWGLDDPVWGGRDLAPVLFHAQEWASKAPEVLWHRGVRKDPQAHVAA